MSDVLKQTFGSNDVVTLKTSLAWNGDARSEGDKHDITLNVSLAGLSVEDMVQDALRQGAVKFQRTRRSADSGGNFDNREQFEEYIEQIGSEQHLHFSDLGRSPEKPKTEAELESASTQSFAQMSPEKQREHLQKLQELAEQAG